MSTNAKVLALVERELKKDPTLGSADLRAKAEKIDKGVAKLSGRQFHARYTIQARKRLPKPAGKAKRRPARRSIRRKPSAPRTAAGDAAVNVLAGAYAEKSEVLRTAVEEAFEKAVATDSLKKMNALMAAMDAQIAALRRI